LFIHVYRGDDLSKKKKTRKKKVEDEPVEEPKEETVEPPNFLGTIEGVEGGQLTTTELMVNEVAEEEQATEEKTTEAQAPKEEPKPKKKPKPSDTVKVKVLIGTLHWEGGSFEKGEVFECSRERALSFGNDVEILEG